jgi:hypothetical protein
VGRPSPSVNSLSPRCTTPTDKRYV